MTTLFAVTLAAVLVISAAITIWQYATGQMLNPEERRIRGLRPLTNGRKPK